MCMVVVVVRRVFEVGGLWWTRWMWWVGFAVETV